MLRKLLILTQCAFFFKNGQSEMSTFSSYLLVASRLSCNFKRFDAKTVYWIELALHIHTVDEYLDMSDEPSCWEGARIGLSSVRRSRVKPRPIEVKIEGDPNCH